MRTGLVAKKLGMTKFVGADTSQACTLLKLESPIVVGQKTAERDGYDAVVVGAKVANPKHVKKQQKGMFAKNKVEARRNLKEFRVLAKNLVPVGSEIVASHFVVGQFVDISGTTQGKGFQGGMKRHGFAGLEASHGISISHRSHGSTGQCQDPGRVFKNKKMAGHMGNTRITQQNLEILEVDDENGIIVIKGSIPGPKNAYVEIKDAVKVVLPQNAPLPAGLKQDNKPQKEEATEAPAEEAKAEATPEENKDES